MKKNARIFLFLVCSSFFAVGPADAQFNTNLAAKLQNTLDSMVTAFPISKGMSCSVYVPGQGIWKGASGLSYAGHPVTTDMVFGLASNTKLFVAVTMLKLAEQNVLKLDDSLRKWIPYYVNVNPNITIRQLLNHTSGVDDPNSTGTLLDSVKAYPTRLYTPQDVIALLGPAHFNPGAGFYYSNVNYILAGLVAQSATGFHISKLIRDNILTPLQMDSTFYDLQEPVVGTIAHRWYYDVDWNDTSRISMNSSGGPAGSLFSTSNEMAQWYHALMSGQLLTSASFAALTTFITPSNYGLGLEKDIILGRTVWGHGGTTLGYTSRMIYDPSMQVVACGLCLAFPAAEDGSTAMLYKVVLDNLPGVAGSISGLTSVCKNQNLVTYTVSPVTNATSYIWTLPSGATGTSTTNSITVNYGPSAVSGNITVFGSNDYGAGLTSKLAVTVNTCSTISLFLRVLIEGYYLGGGMMRPVLYNEGVSVNNFVADSITVSLVDSSFLVSNNDNADLSTAATVKGVLTTNGTVALSIPGNTAGHKYYLRLQHRSAAETWSAKPIMISNNRIYDFTASRDSTYGLNVKDVFNEGIWSIYAGDINHDGGIDGSDFLFLYPHISAGEGGYNISDLNGDGGVDGSDFLTVYPNIEAGKGVLRP